MTRFIVPGDIMRQTQATLRHRGVDMGESSFAGMPNIIAGGGECATQDGSLVGTFVVWWKPEQDAQVFVNFGDERLNYSFTPEES